jgi:hypothetical protein
MQAVTAEFSGYAGLFCCLIGEKSLKPVCLIQLF